MIIPLDEPVFNGNEEKYVLDCIKSGWISWQGKYVKNFESNFKDYIGNKYCTTTANGTHALIIALQALGVGKGDEVIVPTLTFSASAFAVTTVGAKVVFADSYEDELAINHNEIKNKISDKTKAIMPVHLYGYPAKMDSILEIAKENNIFVIEDCAESLGATYNNEMTGSFGDISCFSFHNKLIATGEGGLITTDNEELYDKVLTLQNPAPDNRTDKKIISLNSRMSNINAALGLAQLEQLENIIQSKRNNVKLYNELLSPISGVSLLKENENIKSTYWRYSILIDNDFPVSRNILIEHLNKNQISSRGIFVPMHLHPVYNNDITQEFLNAENLSNKGIDLPSSANLTTSQIEKIVAAIKDCH